VSAAPDPGIRRQARPWLEADAYIFDIDGTLLNSRDAVHYDAFRKALRQIFGIESGLSEVPVHGNTDPGIVRAVAEYHGRVDNLDRFLPQALDLIRSEVRRRRAEMLPEACPGIEPLLQALQGAGKIIGIASGNLEEVAWAKIEAAGLRSYFQFGCFSDHCEHRPAIFRDAVARANELLSAGNKTSAASVCIIGDTPADIVAARANRVPIIAVATGIYSLDELSQHSPDLCVLCCEALSI
jgi:phosphoglycolate phosphatase-like HAD superfamily hydrolase